MAPSTTVFGVDIAGFDHDAREILVYTVGWTLGWLLLWRPRRLPSGLDLERGRVAVVIPARDEAGSLPHLLRPLVDQRRAGDQIVVVDDHSTDGTRRIALGFEVEVVPAPEPPVGWLGKPHACWCGARSTDADTVVFLDADVRPGPTLLDDLAAAVAASPEALVSVQPWHVMETVGEQASILCNVTALMGSGAFTPLGDRTAGNLAFGPVLAIRRSTYDRAGGHGAPGVRSRHLEDIALARTVGRSQLYVGSPATTTFRMYPSGVSELVAGWTRSISTGARFTRWWLVLATFGWVASAAGGWLVAPLLYPVTAIQIWVLGRRAGAIRPLAALLFPLLIVVFVAIFVRSTAAIVLNRPVTWKGRRVDPRTG